MMEKIYLGDAVYADFDGFHIVLTTSDGIRDTNRICLDPSVTVAFEIYAKNLKKEIDDAIESGARTLG